MRSFPRFCLAAVPATGTLWAVASPAGTHHDPDELARTERAADALLDEATSGGLPTSLIVAVSVDGVNGGNATVGTIDSGGLYIAPASPPAGGSVTVAPR